MRDASRFTLHASRPHASRFTLFALLPLSFLIQLLGVAINPWVFLAQLQTEFGGEFFLENTAALYDFRYSQIVGQIQTWSLQNSDLAWWQPWGFDGLAFGLSLGLVLLSGWLLWRNMTTDHRPQTAELEQGSEGAGDCRARSARRGRHSSLTPLPLRSPAPLQLFLTLAPHLLSPGSLLQHRSAIWPAE